MEVTRSVLGRPWRLRPVDEAAALALSQRLGLAEITGRVLAGRGITLASAPSFLAPRLKDWLPDPSHLLDLDRAAARITVAILAGERVGLIGDYDVDGATATALMARYLRTAGVEVTIEVPDRLKDGYGPNEAAIDRLAAAGCTLILVLDAGTTAFGPLAHAAAAGLAVIVVDHHLAQTRLPEAHAVVNPNRHDQTSPLGHLAAVGVTFIVLIAVSRELRAAGWGEARPVPDLLGWLDLVALGTVCDVVPLAGLNRAFVHQGLRVAASVANPGLVALAEVARLTGIATARDLGFVLGPRLNAGGRVGRSNLAARLLLSDDPSEAAGLATVLDDLNRERQALERDVLVAAAAALEAEVATGCPVLVAAGRDWHVGVVGIVASRLVERWQRPTFVMALQEDGLATGSARSVPGFDVGAAVIAACGRGLALKGGGHGMAAGVTLPASALEAFRKFMIERCEAALGAGPPSATALELDGALGTGAIGPELATELDRLGPFGAGHAEPRFCLVDARPVELRPVGTGHLACILRNAAGARVKGIAFRAAGTPLAEALMQATSLRLAGRVKLDTWQGRTGASFQIEDAATPDD